MFEPDTRGFYEKLEIGNKIEQILIRILTKRNINAQLNNEENVKDVDIYLPDHDIYIDCKYRETPFHLSFRNVGIQPSDCLTVSSKHIINYGLKEKSTSKEVWLACFIDYKDYDVKELIFIKNSSLLSLVEQNNQEKLYFSRKIGINLEKFTNYLENK